MEDKKRRVMLSFRVFEDERDALQFLARRDRRTLSDYIRLTLFDFAKTNGNGWREWLQEKASDDGVTEAE